MSHYREPPGDPDASPVVVATAAEVHALAPSIRAYLRRRGVYERDIDDLVQNVEIITWEALEEGRVRGPRVRSAADSLFAFMIQVARNLHGNYRTLARVRFGTVTATPDELIDKREGFDPEGMLGARETLARLAAYPEIAALLVGAIGERPKVPDVSKATAYLRAARFRRWLREVHESGVWREPPMPTPSRPRDRKKAR